MKKTSMKTGDKELSYGLKVSPTSPSPDQLAKINKFTKRPFTADELYIGQMRLANNCIDRDNERFSEFTLKDFVETAIRKTMLLDHTRSLNGAKSRDIRLNYLSILETKTPKALQLTGFRFFEFQVHT